MALITWLQRWSEATCSRNFGLVGDDGAASFRTALEQNDTLMELGLPSSNIGEDGAHHLAAALERNCTLTTLHLFNNDLGQAGAAAFLTALETNCTLAVLTGMEGVNKILKRNRKARVARKHKAMLRGFCVTWLVFLRGAFTLLWFCSG